MAQWLTGHVAGFGVTMMTALASALHEVPSGRMPRWLTALLVILVIIVFILPNPAGAGAGAFVGSTFDAVITFFRSIGGQVNTVGLQLPCLVCD